MASKYGKNIYRISSSLVNGVYYYGGTVLFSGDVNGSFEVQFRHDSSGCGNPDSGIFVEIKDFISWTNIVMQYSLTGTASCWGFNDSNGYGKSVGNNGTGNLLAFDSSIDGAKNSINAFEDPAYTLKTRACDNNADNFMRFNSSGRSFFMYRRRDSSGNLAGPQHGRSCNSTGSGSVTTIKNIFVLEF